MKIFGYEIKRANQQARNYTAAKSTNLTTDWLTTNLAADDILRWALPKLRDRSRDLAVNNDYMKNFLRKLKINVIGPNGIILQAKTKFQDGSIDKTSNAQIESAWQKWGKNFSSVCGQLSLKECLSLAIEAVARDGEVLVRMLRGYDNPFNFALQIIESDYLDCNHNEILPNGNRIRLGIEKDKWGRPAAYHLWQKHPGESSAQAQKKERIPADEIIHLYIKERPSQSRGVPWAHTAILKLRMVGAYEEAAVVNARIGASKMQSIIMGEGIEYTGDSKDAYGNVVNEVEPGMREVLPHGTQIHDTNFAYPSTEFGIFNKAMLRGIASGLGCSYNSLANDLEGVNFSSLRSGLLEERDGWQAVQTWFIDRCLDAIYPAWFSLAKLNNQLKLPPLERERFQEVKWQGRRWAWVDPEADINARILELEAGLTTRQRICAEKGDDFEEILEQLKEEKKMIDEAGLVFNMDSQPAKPKKEENPNANNEQTQNKGVLNLWKKQSN